MYLGLRLVLVLSGVGIKVRARVRVRVIDTQGTKRSGTKSGYEVSGSPFASMCRNSCLGKSISLHKDMSIEEDQSKDEEDGVKVSQNGLNERLTRMYELQKRETEHTMFC